jgi:hypothetical protein
MPIQYSLIRVNAYSRDVLEVFNYQDQDDHTLYNNVRAILSAGEAHTGSSYHIEQTKIMIIESLFGFRVGVSIFTFYYTEIVIEMLCF